MIRASLVCCLALLCAVVAAAPAGAQETRPSTPAKSQTPAKPTWKDLSPAERDALAPLAADWDSFDRDRKRKWLEVAKKYPQLSDDGKQRMQARMKEFARLTPEERRTARENFQRAYELPIEQRQARLEQYKNLPEDKRRELAEQAKKKPDAAPRSNPLTTGKAPVTPKPLAAPKSPAAPKPPTSPQPPILPQAPQPKDASTPESKLAR